MVFFCVNFCHLCHSETYARRYILISTNWSECHSNYLLDMSLQAFSLHNARAGFVYDPVRIDGVHTWLYHMYTPIVNAFILTTRTCRELSHTSFSIGHTLPSVHITIHNNMWRWIHACVSSPWIWKGVSATLPSGRYTLSYPMGRYILTPLSLTTTMTVFIPLLAY